MPTEFLLLSRAGKNDMIELTEKPDRNIPCYVDDVIFKSGSHVNVLREKSGKVMAGGHKRDIILFATTEKLLA
jgi:hypothetical protein